MQVLSITSGVNTVRSYSCSTFLALPHICDTALWFLLCTVCVIILYLSDTMAYFLCCNVFYYFFLIFHCLNSGNAMCCWQCNITLTLHCTSDSDIAVSFWHNCIFLIYSVFYEFFMTLQYLNYGTATCCWLCTAILIPISYAAVSFLHDGILLMFKCFWYYTILMMALPRVVDTALYFWLRFLMPQCLLLLLTLFFLKCARYRTDFEQWLSLPMNLTIL